MPLKAFFRLTPEQPPVEASGIALRNVSRRAQGLILLAAIVLMAGYVAVLKSRGWQAAVAAGDVCVVDMRLRLLLLPVLLLMAAAAVAGAIDGWRSLQHRVWPWPGMWLWHDTPLRSTRYALWRGRLLLGLWLPMMIGLLAYVGWQLLFVDFLPSAAACHSPWKPLALHP